NIDEITGFMGSTNITLRNSGLQSPQPVVVSISPASGESGVGINTTIIAEFSQPLNPTTVTTSTFSVTSGSTITGTRTLSAAPRGANTVVTFTPSAALATNTSYSVSITTGIQSATGNPLLQSFSSSFTTGSAVDNTSPQVVGLD